LNIKDIDKFLASLELARDDAHLRQMFSEYSSKFDTNVPIDPFGFEYKAQQFSLYKRLAGKNYSPANEKSEFDVDKFSVSPFPFCHGSSSIVGDQLMAIGFIIKLLKLPAGARILEFGPGWGNITLLLAKMGYKVTAVDIEPNFIKLIEKRAAMEKLNVELVFDDFSYINKVTDPFDAILFFECFHHASDHLAIIEGFDKAIKPRGIVCFGAEPITDDFPIPWGLRMDGQSLWAIRKNGWLELGFNSAYFQSALLRSGWSGVFSNGSDGAMSSAVIARRLADFNETFSFKPNSLTNQVGIVVDGALMVHSGDHGFLAYGPYVDLPVGIWELEILIDSNYKNSGELIFDIVADHGKIKIMDDLILKLGLNTAFKVQFQLMESQRYLEFRLKSSGVSEVRLNGISLVSITNQF
jgi:2-polyprenyl-3-methyl-5-hydroxy-6-metoxy-1,4-benzoquinol methylase